MRKESRSAQLDEARRFAWPLVEWLNNPRTQKSELTRMVGQALAATLPGATADVGQLQKLAAAINKQSRRYLFYYQCNVGGDAGPAGTAIGSIAPVLIMIPTLAPSGWRKKKVSMPGHREFLAFYAFTVIAGKGLLHRVRRCRFCNQFFYAVTETKIVCSPEHRVKYERSTPEWREWKRKYELERYWKGKKKPA